jgi:hypothetical protein
LVAYNSPVHLSCRGYRHHALLHLVRLHYIKKEYPAARRVSFPTLLLLFDPEHAVVTEPRPLIPHGQVVINHSPPLLEVHHLASVSHLPVDANSILHRLPTESGQRPNLQEIQTDLHPLEILYDTYKLLDEEHVCSPLLLTICTNPVNFRNNL